MSAQERFAMKEARSNLMVGSIVMFGVALLAAMNALVI